MYFGLLQKSTWILFPVIFQCFFEIGADDSINERLINELQIDDLELKEWFENITQTTKNAHETKQFRDLNFVEEYYGELIKYHIETLKEFTNYVPSDLERNLTSMLKPGDWILPATPLSKVLRYKNYIEELKSTVKIPCIDQSSDCYFSENDYLNTLRNSRNLEELNTTWQSWQTIFNESNVVDYARNLQFVKFSAKLNGFNDVREYWQYLIDYNEADSNVYEKAQELWREIEPFYKKLHNFVNTRLQNYYKLNESSEYIPIYLVGDKFGSDWVEIADIILPHPQLHYDVDSFLKNNDVENIYRHSEALTKSLSFGKLGTDFWNHSNFKSATCGPKIFEYPERQYTSIEECNQPSWTTYLDAHETAMQVALNNRDYSSLPRQRLKFSAMDNAISTLGSILAIETLDDNGILPNGMIKNAPADDPLRMTKLLLMALRIFPRLPYYLAVDNFRLQEVEKYGLKMEELSLQVDEAEIEKIQNIHVNATKVGKRWWNQRKKYAGLQGITDTEPDFLNDIRIIQNTPYLNRFYGVIIAFQLVEYYNGYLDEGGDIVKALGEDDIFRKVVDERSSLDWVSSLSIRYGFDINPSALLTFFQPLEEYFDKAPLEQIPIVKKAVAFRKGQGKEVPVNKRQEEANDQGETNGQGDTNDQGNTNVAPNNTEPEDKPPQNNTEPVENIPPNDIEPEPNDTNTIPPDDEQNTDDHHDLEGETEGSPKNETNDGFYEPNTLAMWCGIAILICVSVALVVVFVFTYVKKRRERRRNTINNRRFDS